MIGEVATKLFQLAISRDDIAQPTCGPGMPTYTCLCCSHTETFETAEAAHHASWDVEPYFTLQPLCDWCFAAPIMIYGLEEARRRHAVEHDEWRTQGRPKPIHELTSDDKNSD